MPLFTFLNSISANLSSLVYERKLLSWTAADNLAYSVKLSGIF